MTDGLNRNIRRRDRPNAGTHAWEVKICRDKKMTSKTFSDGVWGGRERALEAARAWRDSAIRKLDTVGVVVKVKPPNPNSAKAPSTTERCVVSEVTRYEHLMPTIGKPRASAFWMVKWVDANGMRLTRKFSVAFLGEEVARQKALAMHAEHLRLARPSAAQHKPSEPQQAAPTVENSPARTRDPEMRCIVRLDKTCHAWKVQIKRAKERKHKYFLDSAYGGTMLALVAAKAWREQMLVEMGGPSYEMWKREIRPSTNTSGIPGVFRGMAGRKHDGKLVQTPYWQGYWTDLDGKRQSRVFSILAYGEEEAKALAIQFRREGLEQVARKAQLRQAAAERRAKSGGERHAHA